MLKDGYIYFMFFDNEGSVEGGQEGGQETEAGWDKGELSGQSQEDNGGDSVSSNFTQDDVNRFLADDRRKHQERYKKLEASYQKMLKEGNLHKEQRHKMQQELEDLQKAFRTKEQQAEYERKQQAEKYKNDLAQATESVVKWEGMYKSSVIDRSLQDAAVSADAFNPGQIMSLLRPMTKMVELTDSEGIPTGGMTPKVDFEDIDEKTGERITTLRTPEEAVKRMRELPNLYGNLFKSNVVSGIGTGSATGGAAPGKGSIDVSRLTPEQYRRLRKEDPALLGLRGKK